MTDKLDNSAPFDDDQGTRIVGKPTGAGAEAAEGIHGEPENRESPRDPSEKTSLTDRAPDSDGDRTGSEPFDSNSHEHQSGYGGSAGEPREPDDIPRSRR